MTDFLGRLVTRVLAPERLLRPRVQSRYESLAPVMAFEEIAATSPTRPSRAPAPPVAASRAPVSPELPSTSPDGGLIARRLLARDTDAHSTHPRQVENPPSDKTSEAGKSEAGESETGERRAGEREAETVTVERPIIIEREVVQPPEVHTVVRTRRGVDRIERLRLRSERTRIERELVSEAPIEITIGRIDVRAVVDSRREAPRATRAPQPSLSLRDYLAQRDARRRR